MSIQLIPETGLTNEEAIRRITRAVNTILKGELPQLVLQDNVPAPTYAPNKITLYADAADGDLKVAFGDGTVKTIVTDT